MKVAWKEAIDDLPTGFETTPIFKYDDPARGLVSAGLARLGPKGRPLAHHLHGAPAPLLRQPPHHLRIPLAHPQGLHGHVQRYPLGAHRQRDRVQAHPRAPPNRPRTPPTRLIQMRAQARRFTASEVVKERFELRLMPQPIERYTPAGSDRADGSMFLLAFGLNPEAILFIESDGKQWNYALGRLAGASKMNAEIDGQPAWEAGPAKYGWQNPYTASNSQADIPGIAPDGTPVKPLEP